MTSAKNKLQEYFQRKNLTLPQYDTIILSTKEWSSTVTFSLDGHDYTYTGPSSLKKKQAECNTAHVAYTAVFPSTDICYRTPKIKAGEILVPKTDHQTYIYVLVDYENINRVPELDRLDKKSNELTVLRFVNHLHSESKTEEANCIVESSIKDAVDHYISFYIGNLCATVPNNKSLHIIVLTRDHFASALPSFVTCYKNITLKHYGNEKKCIDELQRIGIY